MGFWHRGGFFSSVKGHVIKWWQQVILPVLHFNPEHGNISGTVQAEQQIMQDKVELTEVSEQALAGDKAEDVPESQLEQVMTGDEAGNISKMQTDDMGLARQKAEQVRQEEELRRQREMERLKAEAQEQARITSIMNANKIDINAFIKEGEENRNAGEAEKKRQEEMRLAEEIIERLNREAAEDEAKKQAEIEAAKQKAEEELIE